MAKTNKGAEKESSEANVVRLQHMLNACTEIRAFTKNVSEQEFRSHRMLILAILKELELIGEAASKISSFFQKKHPDVQWHAIVAMRNRLIHGYFDINLEIVWNTIQKEIPPLTRLLRSILSKH
jgi:uncharacterized protein with HEPN domain